MAPRGSWLRRAAAPGPAAGTPARREQRRHRGRTAPAASPRTGAADCSARTDAGSEIASAAVIPRTRSDEDLAPGMARAIPRQGPRRFAPRDDGWPSPSACRPAYGTFSCQSPLSMSIAYSDPPGELHPPGVRVPRPARPDLRDQPVRQVAGQLPRHVQRDHPAVVVGGVEDLAVLVHPEVVGPGAVRGGRTRPPAGAPGRPRPPRGGRRSTATPMTPGPSCPMNR